jgi:hypothetical protein
MDILPLPARRLAGPEPLTAKEMARYVVGAAVRAPSVHKTQPWSLSARRQEISLHAGAGRQLMVADARGREMMISCGAALFTVRLALRSLGYIPEACVLPDPGRPLLVVRMSWQRQAAPAEYERRLFSQVLRRRTHRGSFDPVPVSPDLVAVLQQGAKAARIHPHPAKRRRLPAAGAPARDRHPDRGHHPAPARQRPVRKRRRTSQHQP